MDIVVAVFLFLVGLVCIIKGGDAFVDAAGWMAGVSGIPQFVIGATIVSVATTLPELLVSAIAAAQGKIGMSVGNAVGSVTVNAGLILGLLAAFAPCAVKKAAFNAKALLMLGASALLYVFSLQGRLSFAACIALFALFCVFVAENLVSGRKNMDAGGEKLLFDRKKLGINLAKFVFGAAGIVVGANLLVENAGILAKSAGVPESIIAVTLVSVGTSLPELVTAVSAIRKGRGDLSVGNILGANIIDLTLILPVCSFVSRRELPMDRQAVLVDMPMCMLICALAVLPAIFTGRLKKGFGFAILGLYGAYVLALPFVFK